MLEEVFRRWRPELDALGQRLGQAGADLLVPVTSLMNAFAEMSKSLSGAPGAHATGLAAPTDERPAPPVDRQPPAAGSETRLWENGPTLESALMVVGFVSALWLCRPPRAGQQQRTVEGRGA